VSREYFVTNEVICQELTGGYVTPWSRILQKLISPHLIKKSAALVHDDSLPCSRTCHCSEPWAWWFQSLPYLTPI